MKWEAGRQGGLYRKMRIWSFSILNFGTDCYLVDYKPNYKMPVHRDEADGTHYRLNIVLRGKGRFVCEKTLFKLWDRIILFRPDLYEHGMVNGDSQRTVLSLGLLKKERSRGVSSNHRVRVPPVSEGLRKMRKGSIRIDSGKREIADLNKKFHAKTLLENSFYLQLLDAGFEYKKSVIVSLVPDGGNTYFGKIIRQDGKIFCFDLDLDMSVYSEWEIVTDEFLKNYKENKLRKPWLANVLAYDLFLEKFG